MSRVSLGKIYSSNYNSFLRSFTSRLRVSVGRFTERTTLTRGVPSLKERYAIVVGSCMGGIRGHNIKLTSLTTTLSMSIIGGTLFDIVRLRSTRRLKSRVITRNNAFCGSTMLHTFRHLAKGRIVHPSVTNLVNTCKVTLGTGSRFKRRRASSLPNTTRVGTFHVRARGQAYPNYNGRYTIDIHHFSNNRVFIAKGQYKAKRVVLAKREGGASYPSICR